MTACRVSHRVLSGTPPRSGQELAFLRSVRKAAAVVSPPNRPQLILSGDVTIRKLSTVTRHSQLSRACASPRRVCGRAFDAQLSGPGAAATAIPVGPAVKSLVGRAEPLPRPPPPVVQRMADPVHPVKVPPCGAAAGPPAGAFWECCRRPAGWSGPGGEPGLMGEGRAPAQRTHG